MGSSNKIAESRQKSAQEGSDFDRVKKRSNHGTEDVLTAHGLIVSMYLSTF
jgi:hypothetical protein